MKSNERATMTPGFLIHWNFGDTNLKGGKNNHITTEQKKKSSLHVEPHQARSRRRQRGVVSCREVLQVTPVTASNLSLEHSSRCKLNCSSGKGADNVGKIYTMKYHPCQLFAAEVAERFKIAAMRCASPHWWKS